MSQVSQDKQWTTLHGRPLRTLVRIVSLCTAVVLLWPIVDGLALPLYVPAASPFVMWISVVAARTLQTCNWIGLLITVIVLFRRRWFCRWLCPTGFCAEWASRAGKKVGCVCPHFPALGRALALITLAGACLGYPLYLWLDPLALFSGLFNLWGPVTSSTARLSALGLPAVLLISFLFPGLWCGRLCPLRATQDLMVSIPTFLRRRLSRTPGPVPATTGWRLARRALVFSALGVTWAALTRQVRANTARPLRPPGAVDEDIFTGVCVRCGNCIRVCPTKILSHDPGTSSIAGLFAPVLKFSNNYCLEDCVRCTDVCPSGAIKRIGPEAKVRAVIGLPRVDMNICLLGEDRECSICQNSCPYHAINRVFDPVEYTLTPKIDPQRCPGCGACEVACPTKPVKAIVVRPVGN